MDASLVRSFRFMREHAGYVVGQRAVGALALAKAEREAAEAGYTFVWQDDPDGWDSLGDVDPKDVTEVLACVARDPSGEVVASLWGIQDPGPHYSRVVEAELALEALSARS